MGQRGNNTAGGSSGSGAVRVIIGIVAVALFLALAWWGFSIYKDKGTPRVATPAPKPAAEKPAPSMPAAPEKAVEEVPAKETPEETDTELIEPLTVHFEYRSYYLHKAQMADIRRFLASLDSLEGLEFHVDAYTCNKGTRDYNRYLSSKRAGAVARYLKAKGVPGTAITTASHGESDPVASNKTEKGRRQNRRATISVTGIR